MDISPVNDIFQSFLIKGVTIVLPAASMSVVVVVIVAVIMAMMQIQDQSLTFFPKTISIIAVLIILGPWMFGQISETIIEVLESLPALIKV